MAASDPPQKSRVDLIRELQAQAPPLKSTPTARGRSADEVLTSRLPGAAQWQYAVIGLGVFNAAGRTQRVLGLAGEYGWELVAVYDKASNRFDGFEKGFMLFKRAVPDGVDARGFWYVSA